MNNYEKNVAYRILDKLILNGNRGFLDVNEYSTLKDFCLDLVAIHDAPLCVLPSSYTENSDFLKELISRAPQKINELYETLYFTYKDFISKVSKPKILLSRLSRSCKLYPEIKTDLMQLMTVSAETWPI